MKNLIPWLKMASFVFIGLCFGYWHGARWANMQSYVAGIDIGYYMGVSDAEVAYKTSGIDGVQMIRSNVKKKLDN
jgi:hypothetical protein